MAEQAKEQTKAQRERQFGRVYDHDQGTVKVTSAFDKNWDFTLEGAKLPDNVIRGFALQSAADYVVQEMQDVLRDTDAYPDETVRRQKALEAGQEAYQELVEGKVDFRSGVGLGGMRSAIGALGTVLFNLGKTFVVNAKGEKLTFNDIHSARAAVKSLYLDTDEVTKPHPEGGVVRDPKTGHERPRTVTVTGRMIFNMIQNIPEVKKALEELRPPKSKEISGVGSVLG